MPFGESPRYPVLLITAALCVLACSRSAGLFTDFIVGHSELSPKALHHEYFREHALASHPPHPYVPALARDLMRFMPCKPNGRKTLLGALITFSASYGARYACK